MHEYYERSEVDAVLAELGYTIVDGPSGITYYNNNFFPGSEIMIDWSLGNYEWEDLKANLEFNDIDPDPIYERLRN